MFTDQELIKDFVSGNQQSLEILINRHKEKLFSYIKMLVKEQTLAEDIFQDTFIKIIRSFKKGVYKDEGRFYSWATRIAHNLVIDYYRKQKNMKMLSNESCEFDLFNDAKFSEKTIEEKIIKEQILNDLKGIIKELPDDQRSIVIMRLYLNMSFKEIAELTNVSINTALGRMRYAIINLRKLMEEQNLVLMID